MLLVTPLTVAAIYCYQIQMGKQPVVYAQIFPTWFIQYYLGILVKKGVFKMSSLKSIFATLISIYLMSVESTFIYKDLGIASLAVSQIKYTSIIFSIALSLLFLSMQKKVERNILVVLGELSFGIYLLHIPIKIGVERIVTRIMPLSDPFWQFVTVTLTICACFVVIKVANKILPGKVNTYLGLR